MSRLTPQQERINLSNDVIENLTSILFNPDYKDTTKVMRLTEQYTKWLEWAVRLDGRETTA